MSSVKGPRKSVARKRQRDVQWFAVAVNEYQAYSMSYYVLTLTWYDPP